MDLLLQAARVLELEHDLRTTDETDLDNRVALKTQRGSYFHHTKSGRENSEGLNDSQLYINNRDSRKDYRSADGGGNLPMAEKTYKRVGGAGTREVHNQLEKNRRKQLREFFTHLQQCVPSLENKRVATQSILQAAIKHIKNLKKKDVEQEREIQTLARRKSDLKKKYDLEFNKCTLEQQHIASVLLKVIRSKIDEASAEQDGHTSDSTSTASEGPPNEDDLSEVETDVVQQNFKTAIVAGNFEGRKRKLSQRASSANGIGMVESTSSNSSSGVHARSLVSSSSVALKHMLEQRKRNQTVTEQVNSVSSVQREAQMSGLPARSPGSLTYSYPMITTHLASAVRPSVSGHEVAQTNQLMSQSSAASVSSTMSSKYIASSLTQSITATILTKKNKRGANIRSKGDQNTSQTMHNSTLPSQMMTPTPLHLSSDPPLIFTQNPTIYPTTIKLVQPPAMTSKTHDARASDISFSASPKSVTSVSNLDIQNLNYLSQAVVGNHAGALTLDSSASIKRIVDTSISSHKILPAVIPISLTPIIRNLPVSSALPSQMVAIGPSPLALCSSTSEHPTTSISETPATSLLNSKVQLPQGTSYVFTSSSPATTQPNALELSTNAARVAALLAASPSHITNNISCSNSIIKSISPGNSMSSTLCPPSITIPVTIAQTLMPVSLTNGTLTTKTPSSLSSGSPLRILTPLSQSSVLAASLTNGQSPLMPTVVQLETSGKVAVLHNLIPGRQLQVQNPHHILTQPIVVMATAGSDFGTSSSTVTTSSSHVS